jgi:signal transduction histidine kinase
VSRRLLAVLAVTGVAVTAAAAALALLAHDFQPYGPAEKVAQVVADGTWILAGLIAWKRRPDNRVGPLMTALGFVDLTHQFYWDAPAPFTIAQIVSFYSLPVAIHLFLAFPGGRLSTRFERRYVASTYAAVLVFSPVSQLFWDPRGTDCPDCPRNLLLVNPDPGAWSVVSTLGDLLLIGILLTGVVLLVRRVRRATAPTRRAFAPVLLTAALAVVLLGVVVAMDAAGARTEGSVPLWLADLLFAAVPIAFLVGLLRTRWRRSVVADLVVQLGSAAGPAQVRDAIARALGDRSLELAFWLPERQHFIDAAGDVHPVQATPGRAVTMLDHDGKPVAALMHDPSLLEDPGLIEAVGAAASLALENSRLQAELRAQLAEVRASRTRLVNAGDEERRRLERDLHDGAQQRLLGIRIALQLARNRLAQGGGAVDDLLREADAEVVGALEELRALARGIHPAILTEEGLAAALGALVRRAPVLVELNACTQRVPASVEATAYFVAAEALANVVKHAQASRVTIDVTRANGTLALDVTDNGVGGADAMGSGLRGLRDRVEALDGQFVIESPRSRGTRVSAAIPCA